MLEQFMKRKSNYSERCGKLARIVMLCGWFLVNGMPTIYLCSSFTTAFQPANWNQLFYLEIICEAPLKLNTIKHQLHEFKHRLSAYSQHRAKRRIICFGALLVSSHDTWYMSIIINIIVLWNWEISLDLIEI